MIYVLTLWEIAEGGWARPHVWYELEKSRGDDDFSTVINCVCFPEERGREKKLLTVNES